MRIAALVPTRDRAATVHRAVDSFLSALDRTRLASHVSVVVVDDSDDMGERARLAHLVGGARACHPNASIALLAQDPAVAAPARTVAEPGGGPGAARNQGLSHLRSQPVNHDVLIMFDDDVCFADVEYRGVRLKCRGEDLLREALTACHLPRTITGCGYVGRQDLSILEHTGLDPNGTQSDDAIIPAFNREGIDNVAPGGISTAFLTISAPAHALPDFPEHYNEDYVWLHALAQDGWQLNRTSEPLIHAPPGPVAISAEGLSFQIFGEIVWLSVLERKRFPLDDPTAVAAAVKEIVGDLRAALHQPSLKVRPVVAKVVGDVLVHYDAIRHEIARECPGASAEALLAAIRAGLSLLPPK